MWKWPRRSYGCLNRMRKATGVRRGKCLQLGFWCSMRISSHQLGSSWGSKSRRLIVYGGIDQISMYIEDNRSQVSHWKGRNLQTCKRGKLWCWVDRDINKNVSVQMYKQTDIPWPYPQRELGNTNSPIAINTTSAQILASKHHCPLKETKDPERNYWFQDQDKESTR